MSRKTNLWRPFLCVCVCVNVFIWFVPRTHRCCGIEHRQYFVGDTHSYDEQTKGLRTIHVTHTRHMCDTFYEFIYFECTIEHTPHYVYIMRSTGNEDLADNARRPHRMSYIQERTNERNVLRRVTAVAFFVRTMLVSSRACDPVVVPACSAIFRKSTRRDAMRSVTAQHYQQKQQQQQHETILYATGSEMTRFPFFACRNLFLLMFCDVIRMHEKRIVVHIRPPTQLQWTFVPEHKCHSKIIITFSQIKLIRVLHNCLSVICLENLIFLHQYSWKQCTERAQYFNIGLNTLNIYKHPSGTRDRISATFDAKLVYVINAKSEYQTKHARTHEQTHKRSATNQNLNKRAAHTDDAHNATRVSQRRLVDVRSRFMRGQSQTIGSRPREIWLHRGCPAVRHSPPFHPVQTRLFNHVCARTTADISRMGTGEHCETYHIHKFPLFMHWHVFALLDVMCRTFHRTVQRRLAYGRQSEAQTCACKHAQHWLEPIRRFNWKSHTRMFSRTSLDQPCATISSQILCYNHSNGWFIIYGIRPSFRLSFDK